jgi:hypothetical protein
MSKDPQERSASEAEARLNEIHAELRALEAKIDLEAWKKLFNEKIRLERQLSGGKIEK